MSQVISGTALLANSQATARIPCVELRVAWGRTSWPTDWATQSQDETSRLLDFGFGRDLAIDPLQQGNARPASLSITLDNATQRFSAFNTGSAITADILGSTTTAGGTTVTYPRLHGSPVRLRVGYKDTTNGNEFITVFSGYIDDPQGDAYGLSGDRVTLTALDRGVKLVDKRHSTPMHSQRRADDWMHLILDQSDLTRNLNRATFIIPYTWMDDETLWQEIQDAAQADGGWFFVDELGVAQFRSATWWVTNGDSTTVQATITVANFQDLGNNVEWKTMATKVVFEYTPRSPGGEQDLWRSQDIIIIPPGTKTLEARFSYPMDEGELPTPEIKAITTGGRRLNDVYLTLSDITAQRCTLNFENQSGETAFIPPFVLRGHAIMGTTSKNVEHTMVSLSPYEVTKRVNAGPYVQTEAQANMLKVLYGDRLRYPRMTYSVSGFKAMPWLQLGDRVRINVSAPYTSTRDMIVTGIAMSWRPGDAFLQTLMGVDVLGLYEYPDYFIIGTNAYGEPPTVDVGSFWL